MLEIAISPPESTYILATVFGIIYALILSTKYGRQFARSETTAWIATAVGILLVWSAAFITGGEFTLMLFVFAGVPIAIRSGIMAEMRRQADMEKAFDA